MSSAEAEAIPDASMIGIELQNETPKDEPFANKSMMDSIPSSSFQDLELGELLGVNVYNQTELEEGILKHVDEQEKEKQTQFAKAELVNIQDEIRAVKQRLKQIEHALAMPSKDVNSWTKQIKRQVESIKREKENKEKQMKKLLAKQKSLLSRIDGRDTHDLDDSSENEDEELDMESRHHLENIFGVRKNESKEEKLIRTGHMTPFGTVIGVKKPPSLVQSSELTDFEKYLLSQEKLSKGKPAKKKVDETPSLNIKEKIKNKKEEVPISQPTCKTSLKELIDRCTKKRKKKEELGTLQQGDKKLKRRRFYPWKENEQVIDLDEFNTNRDSDSDYLPSSDEDEKPSNKSKKKRKYSSTDEDTEDEKKNSKSSSRTKRYVDDGNESDYIKRIKNWKRERLKIKHNQILEGETVEDPVDDFQDLGDNFKVPTSLWNKLYKYQQTCVQWLWELHCQQCGGIIGDEMGLGKTIQIIAFLSGLWCSKLITRGDKYRGLGPVLIVAPTTIMQQWVKEFHVWWPPFRVAVLHESGSYNGTKESLVRNINNFNGVLLTSYGGVTAHQQLLLRYDWHYVILDEGHKIRNPDAQITLACKQFQTPHRLILSGSPLQNNLKELWSLFDFIFPGKLGTLPVFMEQFSVPITLGGYANASTVQIRVAYKCATVLRDTINPYILRRMKSDVKMNLTLPNKNEQVLFCQLTDEQRSAYKAYLDSAELKSIMDNRLQVFVGLVNLRKICNHPDLFTGGPKLFGDEDETALSEEMRFGYWKKSGKMIVVESILKIWHQQKHRVLLFSQSRQMLHILENFIQKREYTYFRMDGTTSIGARQPLINQFNTDESIFIFLLTTRVGGLGVNLTGADRVIIFDPDWNPSTDLQAKERVWRIGQQKNVTIYRLLTTGTIEEKIYHRQIFKQFLTNRVLKDPRQRRFFKNNELYELFTLQEQGTEGSESLAVFAGTGSTIKAPKNRKTESKFKVKNTSPKKVSDVKTTVKVDKDEQLMAVVDETSNGVNSETVLNEEKCKQMRELAKKISQQLANKTLTNQSSSLGNGERKKKKKKIKSTLFDGERVSHLVKQETYQKESEKPEDSSKQDDYVLKKLFSKTGLQSALRHDKIMESPDCDYKLVEAEADNVAKASIKKLKQSRRFCFSANEGIPNWTGSTETLPKTSKPRFGQKKNTQLINSQSSSLSSASSTSSSVSSLSSISTASTSKSSENEKSADKNLSYNMKTKTFVTSRFESTVSSTKELLSKVKELNRLENGDSESDDEVAVLEPSTENDELLVDIRNFIAFQSLVNGQASTQELLDHFKNQVPKEKTPVFKALLYQVCDFSKDTKVWYLKSEFR